MEMISYGDRYMYIQSIYIHIYMCTYEGLGISNMSFPLLDGLFVYVCRHEWEGLELLLSCRMVWPQTQPLLHMCMYMYIPRSPLLHCFYLVLVI